MRKMMMGVAVLSLVISLSLLSTAVDASIDYTDATRVQQAAEKCRQGPASAATKEWLTDLYSGKITDEPNDDLKCYFKCLMDDLNMFDANGNIQLREEGGSFWDCKQKSMEHQTENLCDKAYHFNKCIHMQYTDLPIV